MPGVSNGGDDYGSVNAGKKKSHFFGYTNRDEFLKEFDKLKLEANDTRAIGINILTEFKNTRRFTA